MAQNALNNPEAYKSFDVFDSASPSIPPAHTPTPVKERPQNTSNTNDRESEKSPKKVKNVPQGKRDWNKEFQTLLERIRDPNFSVQESYMELSCLGSDFVATAKTYGQIFISEVDLEDSQRSICVVPLGGVAGGTKYVCNNIVFKLAIDHKKHYGGDHNAAKAANHELRYLAHFYELNIPGLHFPLMCTITWCGFRLIAMSKIPIKGAETLIYGSVNAGETIEIKDKIFESKMKEAASKMNLASHFCGTEHTKQPKGLHMCTDLEGHKGLDGRYYVLDTARLFPPEYIGKKQREAVKQQNPEKPPELFLFLHLRPELVLKWKQPLNPDMLSSFVYAQYQRDEDAFQRDLNALRQCTKYLKNELIPSFAKSLLQKYSNMNDVEFRFLNSDRLIAELHEAGINIRYLGLVKQHFESQLRNVTASSQQTPRIPKAVNRVREYILLEMICRVIKNELNMKMRQKMKELGFPSTRPFDQIVIDFYNRFLSSANFWIRSDNPNCIKSMIINKFGPEALNDEEKTPNQTIAPSDPRVLIARLEQLTGIKLYSNVKDKLQYSFRKQHDMLIELLSVEDIEARDARWTVTKER